MSVFSCANPGRPDGGPYDETPPKIVGTTPAEYSVNNVQQRITLMFDEYIRLNNAAEKVVISPPQLEQPEIRASGRKILIELRDSLRANTTYTIDFSDAIEDNNEGNPMESYAFVFSTGENIDTMEVSGKVLDASNLEPVKGILVGLHSNLEDSAFTTTPLEHIGRTDGSGKFVIKGLSPGKYRIYALNDAENDFIFKQKSEDIAFTEDIIIPTSEPATRQDTTWVDSVLIDTIKTVAYTHYMPDDIVLRSFKETLTQRHLLKTERKDPFSFTIYFTAASKHFPELKGINFDEKDAFVIQSSETNDTITYWVRDTAVVAKDTLAFKLTYEETDDSTGQNIMTTDTLELISRISYSRIMKDREEAMEKWKDLLKSLGYSTFFLSTKQEEDMKALKADIQGKTCLFLGQSGVGKSSLLNTIFPKWDLKIGSYSSSLGRGRHQTKEVLLLPYEGGYLADTPGFSSLELELTMQEIQENFPGFKPYIGHCFFKDCIHVHEKKCALKEAVEKEQYPQVLYDLYLELTKEITEDRRKLR